MSTTILIIDDNKDLRENTDELLTLSGYKTYTAEDGKEGLQLARKYKPSLILCDIMMPVLDGYGVLRAIENIPDMLGIPFVFMTAKAEPSDFRKGMDMGADDYLVKPFNGDDLLRIVDARIKKSQLIRKTFENNLEGLNDFISIAKMQQGVTTLSENRILKKIRKKDMLYMEGDSPNFLYFVVSGKIKIFKSNEWGKEFIVDIKKDGDFIGYAALLEDSKYKESAMAIENSELTIIPRKDFFQLLYSNSEVAIQFVKLMSGNYSEAEEKLLKLAYDSARKRVAEAIIFVSQKYRGDGNKELSFALHRENISGLSGISPESVSRNLTDFKEEGLIEISNGNLKIINMKKLESLKN